MKKCPFCSEEIQADATKCRHCKEFLADADTNTSTPSSNQPPNKNLGKCKTCKKDVANNTKKCPHCGEKDPTTTFKDTAVGCIIVLAVIVGFCFYAVKCTDSHTESNQTKAISSKWYENGNLHKSTIKEWKVATYNKKLATSADWVLTSNKITQEVQNSGSIDNAKPYASELLICIDKAIEEQTITDNNQTTEIATGCMMLLGWAK